MLLITNVHMTCTSDSLNPAKSTLKGVLSLHTISASGSQRVARAGEEACCLSSISACLAGLPPHYLSSLTPTVCMLRGLPWLSQHLSFRAAVFCFGVCFPPGVFVHGVGQLCPNH